MKYIGREEEKKIINDQLDRNSFSNILIYGRRRVGKTELISKCLSNRKERIIYFTALKISYKNNIDRLSNYIKDIFNTNYSFDNLNSILDYISERSLKEKIIFVIDEFSFLIGNNNLVESELQIFCDKNANNKNLKMIISGSMIDIMKSIIEGDKPLYGRFTSIIDLKPLNYYEVGLFFNDRSNEEKVLLYSILGGIPHYLKLVDEKLSVEDNIIKLFFSKDNIMDSEIEILLNSEISKIETANTALSIINNNSLTYTEINQKLSTNNKSNESVYILNKLLSMDIIDKEISINNDKKATYYIKDNALLFYYTFVLPNINKSTFMSSKTLYKNIIEKQLLNNYVPKQFEKICKEFLIIQNKKDKIKPVFYNIGKLTYHDKKDNINNEFDIVTLDDNGYIYYECKYINKILDIKTVENEISSAKHSSFDFYNFGFFSKKGFDKNIKTSKYNLYSLDDIYK